jgi:hypothetical protein
VEAISRFVRAVQAENMDALYCLLAGAAEAKELGADPEERRAGLESWVESRYEAYAQGRERGQVDLDEQGISLVKLFALGKGTFVTHRGSRSAGSGVVVVESEVRFGYAHVDLSGFPPGTILYFCGVPPGRVQPVRIPAASAEVTVELLDAVRIEWTLMKTQASPACRAGWAVASAAPIDGSARATTVTWSF